MFTKIITLLAFAVVGIVHAQITYVPVPQSAWTGIVSPVLEGNGVYISPDGALAVVVSRDASVTAFNSLTGDIVWQTLAQSAGSLSFGGAEFCYGTTKFVLISAVDTTNTR